MRIYLNRSVEKSDFLRGKMENKGTFLRFIQKKEDRLSKNFVHLRYS